jgi:hypothetical protein
VGGGKTRRARSAREAGAKVFVTGSTGLLGNNLVRQLLERGFDVVGLVRSEEKARRMFGETKAVFVKGDMLDVARFAPAIDGCVAVFHTAAYFRNLSATTRALDGSTFARLRLDEADRAACAGSSTSRAAPSLKPDGRPATGHPGPTPKPLLPGAGRGRRRSAPGSSGMEPRNPPG